LPITNPITEMKKDKIFRVSWGNWWEKWMIAFCLVCFSTVVKIVSQLTELFESKVLADYVCWLGCRLATEDDRWCAFRTLV
jgi:hypothetical protein